MCFLRFSEYFLRRNVRRLEEGGRVGGGGGGGGAEEEEVALDLRALLDFFPRVPCPSHIFTPLTLAQSTHEHAAVQLRPSFGVVCVFVFVRARARMCVRACVRVFLFCIYLEALTVIFATLRFDAPTP